MDVPERRQLERAAPERLVYVDLKPDNGGIVLNVSDGGLCFQAVAPVKKHQSFSVSFSDQKLETEAVGEVVWTDESRKFGGLRFTRVSPEVRNEIGELLRFEPKVSDADDEDRSSTLPVRADEASIALVPAQVEQVSPLQAALLRPANYLATPTHEQTNTVARLSNIVPARLKLPARPQRVWVPRIFIAALLIYSVGATITLFRYHRQQVRVSQTVPAAPQTARSATQVGAPASAKSKRFAGSAAIRHQAVARVANSYVTQAAEPERPLIKGAPASFEYPGLGDGTPSGTVDLQV
ncbi:MAG: PilZ domain-containing protein, partial [Terriglobales bacterium]